MTRNCCGINDDVERVSVPEKMLAVEVFKLLEFLTGCAGKHMKARYGAGFGGDRAQAMTKDSKPRPVLLVVSVQKNGLEDDLNTLTQKMQDY